MFLTRPERLPPPSLIERLRTVTHLNPVWNPHVVVAFLSLALGNDKPTSIPVV